MKDLLSNSLYLVFVLSVYTVGTSLLNFVIHHVYMRINDEFVVRFSWDEPDKHYCQCIYILKIVDNAVVLTDNRVLPPTSPESIANGNLISSGFVTESERG